MSDVPTPTVEPTLADDVAAHIFSPYEHVASLSSKNVRARIADAFNVWLHLPSIAVDAVKSVIDKLHNASLLVDDIEDSSVLRRGAPTAHQLFGMPLTLNCANHVYFIALSDTLALVPRLIESLEKAQQQQQQQQARDGTGTHNEAGKSCTEQAKEQDGSATTQEQQQRATAILQHYQHNAAALTLQLATIFASELVELHEGQGMDILWRDSFACPSLAQYDTMVLKKTGGLFRLALRMMLALAPPPLPLTQQHMDAAVSGSSPPPPLASQQRPAGEPARFAFVEARESSLLHLVNTIGIFFQTLDDLLNVTNTTYHHSKSFCDDLTEGKFSYPVIHCILASRPKGDHRLFHILRQRPKEHEVKAFAVQLMHEAGSVAACRARVEALRTLVHEQVDALGGCPPLVAALQALASMMN